MAKLLAEKNVRRAFEASLVLKGIFAALEVVGGVLEGQCSQLLRDFFRSRRLETGRI